MTITEALRILELTPPFTEASLKKAYREAHLVWHPDRFPTNPELHAKANARACLINEAFEDLSRALEAGYDFIRVAPRAAAMHRKVASQEPPKNAAEFNTRGVGYQNAGRPNKAIADFTEAIRLDPTAAVYYRNRGIVYANRRRLPNAIADFSEAVRLDPNIRLDPVDAYSFRARADVYKSKGEYDNAILDFIEAIRLEPEVAESYFQRGVIYLKKGECDKAIADFTEVRRLDPRRHFCFRESFRAHGTLCEAKGEYDKAIGDYSEVIQSFKEGRTDRWSELVDDYSKRARVYRLKGEWDSAIADYSKSIDLIPSVFIGGWQSAAAYYKCRAQIHYYKGDFSSAMSDLIEAMRRDPEGVWYISQGMPIRLRQAHPSEDGWTHTHALATLASLCDKAGDFSHAIQYQTAFLKLTDITAEEATDGLASLKLYEAHLSSPHTPS